MSIPKADNHREKSRKSPPHSPADPPHHHPNVPFVQQRVYYAPSAIPPDVATAFIEQVEYEHHMEKFYASKFFELMGLLTATIRFEDRKFNDELARCGSKQAMIVHYEQQLQVLSGDPMLKVVDVRDGSVIVDFHSRTVMHLLASLTKQDSGLYLLGGDRVKFVIDCKLEPSQAAELLNHESPLLLQDEANDTKQENSESTPDSDSSSIQRLEEEPVYVPRKSLLTEKEEKIMKEIRKREHNGSF